MVTIYLAPSALEPLQRVLATGLPDSTAIVISPEPSGEGLIARFVDVSTVRFLKTQFLQAIPPGIAVHSFGVEPLEPDVVLELSFQPSRDSDKKDCPVETNMSFTFQVDVHKHRQAKSVCL